MHSEEAVAALYEFTGFIRCSLYFTCGLPSSAKQTKGGQSTKLIYSLFDADDYCIFSESLKQLLENNWCSLDRMHEGGKDGPGATEAPKLLRKCECITPQNAEEGL